MGKTSDIWVRLGLKKNEFDKGMDDAAKKTEQTGGKMSKMLSAAKAGWALLGTAVIAAAKTMVNAMANASNSIGDKMAIVTRQVEAVWQTVITSISAGFNNLVARAESSARAAKALQEMEDAEFEMLNSVALRRAEMEQELIRLEIESRDATKSYDDRAKAAKRYLELVGDLYDTEMNYYHDLARQSAATWLDSASTPGGSILGYSEGNAAALYRFLKEYGDNTALQDAVKNYRQAWEEAGELWNRTTSGKEALRWVNENRQDWGQTTFRRFALDLGWSYEEQKNDELNGAKLIDNIKKYLESRARRDLDTRKMQTNLNSLTAQINNGSVVEGVDVTLDKITNAHELAFKTGQQIADDLRSLNEEFAEVGDIDIDLSDVDAEIQAFLDEWKAGVEQVAELNNMLEDSIVSAMSNGLQAIMDMAVGLEGADMKNALAAFIAPFGDMAKNMGAMIMAYGLSMDAFKKAFSNPYVAIAAGAGLMAIGAAISAGAKKIASGSAGGGATSSYSGGGSYGSTELNYESTLTVEVVGKISGSDILIAGQNQQNKWNR